MIKVAIITEGALPVPAVKGGAVGELIECLVRQNENFDNVKLTIYSIYDDAISDCYLHNSEYCYLKPSKLTILLDKILFTFINNIVHFKKSEKFKSVFQRLSYLRKVKSKLECSNYDYTFLEGNTTLLLLIKQMREKNKNLGKIVFHLHNDVGSVYNCEDIVNQLFYIVGNSQYVIDCFMDTHKCGYYVQKYVLKNCYSEKINLNKNKLVDIKSMYGIPSNDKIILFVGRITPQKGVKELLLSYIDIEYDATLLIVGSSMFGLNVKNSYEDEIKKIASKSRKKVIFTGYIPNDQLKSYYHFADIAVFPSLYGEAAGLTIIEALSLGKKVITTSIGGIPEYVDKDMALLLQVDNELIDNLKKALEYMLHDTSFNTDEIREKIASLYNEEVYYKEFIKIICK